MTKLRKIASFTLTEMLVVLAISSIVVGLAYAILSLFSKNLLSIQDNYSQSTELRLLEEQLTIDFNRFHEIQYSSGTEKLQLRTPIDSVYYTFGLEHIIRNSDTLYSAKNKVSKFLLGTEISFGTVDALKLEFGLEETKHTIFISRKPDARHYIRQHGN